MAFFLLSIVADSQNENGKSIKTVLKTDTMKLLLFGDISNEQIRRLQRLVNNQLPGIHVKPIISFENLLRHLRKPLHRVAAIVMFLSSEEAIGQVLGLKALLRDTRLILVLTDNDKKTLSMALQLNPSFISYLEMGVNDILSVLRKIFIRNFRGVESVKDLRRTY